MTNNKKLTTLSIATFSLLNLSACSIFFEPNKNTVPIKQHQILGVDFSWEGTSRCLGESPRITLTDVPKKTHRLEFSLKDIYFPFFPHGGGSLVYNNINVILEGKVTEAEGHYIGPCAPPFFPGKYEFSVKALNSDGETLAEGNATRPFPHR